MYSNFGESCMALLYEDITGKILETSFEVSNELGAGFLESVYHNSLAIALQQKNIQFETQYPISVTFRGHSVGQFYADFFVEERLSSKLKLLAPCSQSIKHN